jgi:hypothetical protein
MNRYFPRVLLASAFLMQSYELSQAQQSVAPAAPQAAPAPADASVAPPAAPSTAAPVAPLVAPSGKIVLTEGSDIPLTFNQDLSSKTAVEGDPVEFVLAEDIKVGDVVVAKAGSKAIGEVTNSKKAGMMGKAGELNIRLDYLKVGDTKVKLRGSKGKEGESGTTSAVVLTVLFGPIGLIKHGHNIEIKKGSPLKVFVSDDIGLVPVS